MSRPRQRRSIEEWALLIAEYRAGSESDAEFCERHGLSRHTFRRYKYGRCTRRGLGASNGSGFTEVTVSPRDPGVHVTVYGVDGMRIEVPVSAGMVAVAELVKALGHGR